MQTSGPSLTRKRWNVGSVCTAVTSRPAAVSRAWVSRGREPSCWRSCQKRSRSFVVRCFRWKPTRAAPPVRVQGGSREESRRRMRHCRGVSLSPDMPPRFPGLEQPGPELPGLPQIALQARPELPDLTGGDECEDVVRFGLAHQFADEIGADIRVRALEPLLEILERHLAVPEEVGMPLFVDEFVWWGRIQHGVALRSLPSLAQDAPHKTGHSPRQRP